MALPTALGQPSATDFLPIVRGGPRTIANRDAVSQVGDLFNGETAQDAVNYAMETGGGENAQQMQETGAKWIRFKSGAGVMATGISVYSKQLNPNAARLAQRNAYVIAYANAKASMAQHLGGVSNNSETVLTLVAESINGKDTMKTTELEQTKELISQASEALLRGYVVYSVDETKSAEDPDTRIVAVTIVSTPKTLATVARRGSGRAVDSLHTGLDGVLGELKQGIVPPVGGRVITVAKTGETAFVAFGSAVVKSSPSATVTAKNKLTAQKVAAARANDALSGMFNGDKTIWSTGVQSKVATGFEESLKYTKSDPLNDDKVDETLESFNESFNANETIRTEVKSLRSGTLPPGIKKQSWFSDDGAWAYTMVVYLPELSAEASKFAEMMRKPPTQGGQSTLEEENSHAAPSRKIDNSLPPLKSGKVQSDEEL